MGFRVWGLGFRVLDVRLRVQGLGCKVWGSGFGFSVQAQEDDDSDAEQNLPAKGGLLRIPGLSFFRV